MFVEAFGGDGDAGAEVLGVEGDMVLFEHPAEVGEVGVVEVAGGVVGLVLLKFAFEGAEIGGEGLVFLELAAGDFFEAALEGGEVAGVLLEPDPRGGGEEVGGDELGEAVLDIVAGGGLLGGGEVFQGEEDLVGGGVDGMGELEDLVGGGTEVGPVLVEDLGELVGGAEGCVVVGWVGVEGLLGDAVGEVVG